MVRYQLGSQAPDGELGASLLKKREQNLRHSELVSSGRLGGIMEIVREAGVETLDIQEKKVLVECNSRAFWNVRRWVVHERS